MGLDMNLYRKLYYGGEYKTHEKDHEWKESHSLTVGGEYADKYGIKVEDISEIKIACGYWRKANQVHKYFCDSVNQPDLNGYARVSTSDIVELQMRCEVIIEALNMTARKAITDRVKEVALDLLPPSEGFFFGSYEIDKYYMMDIKDTLEICDKALDTPDEKEWSVSYEYFASW